MSKSEVKKWEEIAIESTEDAAYWKKKSKILLSALESAMDAVEYDYLDAKSSFENLEVLIGSEAYESERWVRMDKAKAVYDKTIIAVNKGRGKL